MLALLSALGSRHYLWWFVQKIEKLMQEESLGCARTVARETRCDSHLDET